MAARDDGSAHPSIEFGPADADVIESGRDDSPRRAGRLALGWVLVLVLIAGGVGYLFGDRHGKAGRAAPKVMPSVAEDAEPPIVGTGKRCSVQVQRDLVLGVEVINQSNATVTLNRLVASLPMKGLRPGASTWGSCGQLPDAGTGENFLLAPGRTTWLTMRFGVLVACPGPLPVLFDVDYLRNGIPDDAGVPGFPDLGDVPYAGGKC